MCLKWNIPKATKPLIGERASIDLGQPKWENDLWKVTKVRRT